MRAFLFMILSINLAFSGKACADFLNLRSRGFSPSWQSFYSPNEYGPQFVAPLMAGAPQGVYITVGTERAFTVAAVTPEISHLLIADADPNITMFNQVNIALLKISPNQKFYREFRKNPTLVVWNQIREAYRMGNDPDADFFTAEKFEWWMKNSTAQTLESYDSDNWDRFYNYKKSSLTFRKEGAVQSAMAFGESQYLENAKAYKKISTMAKEGRIQAVTANLTDSGFLYQVNSELKKNNLKIAGIDISNCWSMSRYMSAVQFKTLISTLASSMTDQTRLIISKAKSMANYIAFRPLIYVQERFGQGLQRLADFIFKPESLLSSRAEDALTLKAREADRQKSSFMEFKLWDLSLNQVVDQDPNHRSCKINF
jgi:hypothetical protein